MPSGDTLAVFTPLMVEPPATSPATLDLRNEHPVLDFDASSAETAIFSGVLPSYYEGGGLAIVVAWAATSATSGDAVWSAAFERHAEADIDLDADNFGASQSAVASAPGAAGQLRYTTITLDSDDLDDARAGEHFRLAISRLAGDGGDTLAGDAELVSVEVREA